MRLIGLADRYIRLGAARLIHAVAPPHEPIARIGHRSYGRTIAAVGYLLGGLAVQRTAFGCGGLQGEGVYHEGYIDMDVAARVGHGDGVRVNINLIADVPVVISVPGGYADVVGIALLGIDRYNNTFVRRTAELFVEYRGTIRIDVVHIDDDAQLERCLELEVGGGHNQLGVDVGWHIIKNV